MLGAIGYDMHELIIIGCQFRRDFWKGKFCGSDRLIHINITIKFILQNIAIFVFFYFSNDDAIALSDKCQF